MGSITEALKARSKKLKKTVKETENKPKPKTKSQPKPRPKAKPKTKTKTKTVAKPRTKSKSSTKPKTKTVAKSKTNPKTNTNPKKTKTADTKRTRVVDRDRDGDGLRPVERDVLRIVARGGGTMAILNVAERLFGKPSQDIPREGPGSVRVVRNAVRKPVEYGILKWSSRGVISLTKKNYKESIAAADRYRARVKKAASAGASKTKSNKTTRRASPAKPKKANTKAKAKNRNRSRRKK